MQIYGIDLAKEKFDVSFFDLTSKKVSNKPSHKVVKNNFKSIGRFLETLPSDAVLVAEHTGVYGDTLLKCCMDSNVKIANEEPGVGEIHNLRTRRIGNKIAIEMHVRMPGSLSLYEAHEHATHIERRLKQHFGADTHVGIHLEPIKVNGKYQKPE